MAQYKGRKDIVFLAPEVAEGTVEDVQKFTKRIPFDYQVTLDGKKAAMELYQAKIFPANFLIDKKGIIRMGYVGNNPLGLAEISKMIPALLDETSGSVVSKK